MVPEKKKIIDCFCGIDGFTLGFKDHFDVICGFDNDKETCRNYSAITGIKSFCLDLSKTIPDFPGIDGIIGGPPCQSFSRAGTRRGINEFNGQLTLRFFEIVKNLNPEFFVMENVLGILDFNEIKKIINQVSINYKISINIIDGIKCGLAQTRKRVFIVGHKTILIEVLNPDMSEVTTLNDVLRLVNNPTQTATYRPNYNSKLQKYHSVLEGNKPVPTITGKWCDQYLHPKEKRRLSIEEIMALQGFENNHQVWFNSLEKAYQAVGNAVAPPMSQVVSGAIARIIYSQSSGKGKTMGMVKVS
jgi:DNA (cytosine-5)-methyltransferase 1